MLVFAASLRVAIAKAGAAHTYWNAASIPTRYLLITPRIRQMIAVPHDANRRHGRSVAEVIADYDTPAGPERPPADVLASQA